jgi:ferredoxin-NADP reductase
MPSDPFEPRNLKSLVPDVRRRDVYLCGSVSMMERVERSLRSLGVPAARIHTERFSY